MKQSLGDLLKHPMLAAFAGALLPTIISVVCVWLTYSYTSESQDRQLKITLVASFDQTSNQIVDAGGMFLASINNNSNNIEEARKIIATLSGKQMLETDSLKNTFGDVGEIASYQEALKDFRNVAYSTQTAADIKPWAESFGKVIDAKITLTSKLYHQLGIKG
jgi:hypothetical protein